MQVFVLISASKFSPELGRMNDYFFQADLVQVEEFASLLLMHCGTKELLDDFAEVCL